jgi:transcriptional regulator of met regulon
VKVTTVGGVVTGLAGAAAVVEEILHGAAGQGARRARGMVRALRHELNRHLLIRRALHGFTEREYRAAIDLLSPRTKELLGRVTRDEAGRILMRLLVTEPRLVLLGLRALIRKNRSGADFAGV